MNYSTAILQCKNFPIVAKWFLELLQKLRFVKSLKFEKDALLKKKKGSIFLSGPILKNISGLNYILKEMFHDFHSLLIISFIHKNMYYKIITIINNYFFLRVLNYRFLACCIFSAFFDRASIFGNENFDQI